MPSDLYPEAPRVVNVRKARRVAGLFGLAAAFVAVTTLALFFCPLVDIGQEFGLDTEELVASQSGYEAVIGKWTWQPRIQAKLLAMERGVAEPLRPAPMMIAYAAALLLNVVIAVVPVGAGMRFGAAFCCSVAAVGLLIGQAIVGFPLAAFLQDGGYGDVLNTVHVHYTRWYGLSFIAVSVGTFLSAMESYVANRRPE